MADEIKNQVSALSKKRFGRSKTAPKSLYTRRKADVLCSNGETPLDVMIENMLFWRNKSHELECLMMEKLDLIRVGTDESQQDQSVQAEILKTISAIRDIGENLLRARENSEKCAVDAAPYVNPRVASVVLDPRKGEPSRTVRMTLVIGDKRPVTFDAVVVPPENLSSGTDADAA